MQKKLLTIALALILSCSLQAQDAFQIVKGTILDQQTEIPLIGATVELVEAGIQKGTTTNVDGEFKLEVPYGRQKFVVSYLGYEPAVISNILVTAGKEVVLDVKLEESIINLQEVTVTSKSATGTLGNEMATVSSRVLSVEEITRFAGSVNDISRMAANYAGVLIPDNQRNDIIIRGNSPVGLLWRLEGVPIANPNHFASLGATGGVVSAVNPNILKNSDFLTGAFPAEYGNTNSGVMDLSFRNGNKDKFEFTTQLAAFSGLEAMIEGPFSANKKNSFVVGYRHSFLELLDLFNLSIGIDAIPNYKDLSFKVDFEKTKFGKFSMFGIAGTSDISFIGDDDKDISGSRLATLGLNHRILVDDKSYIKTTIAYSGSESTYKEFTLENDDWNMDFENKDVNNRLSLSSFYHKKINPRWNLRTGITSEWYSLNFNSKNNNGQTLETIRDFNGNLALFQAHAQSQYKISPKLSINAGLHAQLLTLNDDYAIEPRLALNYQLTDKQALSIGYGLHNQMQPLPVYFFETEVEPGQFLRTNENLGFSTSNHFIFGYDVKLGSDWAVKVDAYYQAQDDIPVETESSYFSVVNSGADFVFPTEDYLVNGGTGTNYGLELTVEKYFSNSYYGLFTLSLLDSKYAGSDGVERNTAFNNGYILNFLAGKEFSLSKKNDNKLTFDFKLTNAGGRYYTPIDLEASRAAQRTIRDFDNAYTNRFWPYFRMDAKIGYRLNSKKKKFSQHFYVEFQNISNTRNALNNYYSVSRDEIRTRTQLGFFFDILYRVRF